MYIVTIRATTAIDVQQRFEKIQILLSERIICTHSSEWPQLVSETGGTPSYRSLGADQGLRRLGGMLRRFYDGVMMML